MTQAWDLAAEGYMGAAARSDLEIATKRAVEDALLTGKGTIRTTHVPLEALTGENETGGEGYPDNNPKSVEGAKKPPLNLCPPVAKVAWSAAMAEGARKYGAYNWRENSVALSVYTAALERHLDAYKDGEDVDPLTGIPHLGSVMACASIILDAAATCNLIDDRPWPGGAGEAHRQWVRDTETRAAEWAESASSAPAEEEDDETWQVGDRVYSVEDRAYGSVRTWCILRGRTVLLVYLDDGESCLRNEEDFLRIRESRT